MRISSVGAARIIGPSSAATRCSPMKNELKPVHACEALLGVEALVPIAPVLGEVEVLRAPLLALPELVELVVGQELDLAAVGRLHEPGIARGLEVDAIGAQRRGLGHALSFDAGGTRGASA